jgi:LL-diaminopimelate aminotransferase
MIAPNPAFTNLKKNYLFVEIANRRKAFQSNHPNAKIISLGIGDTTEPLPQAIVNGLRQKCEAQGIAEHYQGYPDYNGSTTLRAA